MNNQDVFKQISKDLGIVPYQTESQSAFYNRLAYSAIGSWARMIASVSDSPTNNIGNIHKSNYHRKLREVIDRFASLLEDDSYFFPNKTIDPAGIIRGILMCAGDLVEIGFNSRISTVSPELVRVDGLMNDIVVGIGNDPVIGKGLSQMVVTHSQGTSSNLFERFNIAARDAAEVTSDYIKNARWELIPNAEDYEVFNPSRKGVLSGAWESWNSKSRDIVTIARIQLSFGAYDYRLLKCSSGLLYVARLSDYAQAELVRDTQRLLYGFKSLAKSNYRATVEKYTNYSVWHFWSKLPPQEEKLLFYLGWPLKSIENKSSEFVIGREFDSCVYQLSNNLCIEIEETDYE